MGGTVVPQRHLPQNGSLRSVAAPPFRIRGRGTPLRANGGGGRQHRIAGEAATGAMGGSKKIRR